MSISIQRATPQDAPTLLALIRALAAYEREPDAVELSEAELRRQLSAAEPPFQCFLAKDEAGAPLGFALFFFSYSTWRGRPGVYLEDLFVLPEARRMGVGRALLQELIALGRTRGCARLEWSVLDWNEPAINFYRALQATPMEGWTTWRLNL